MPYLIAVGGGSGSGKTFLAHHLLEEFGDAACTFSYDNYCRDQSALSVEARALVNYDVPSVYDEELFLSHLEQIRKNQPIQVAIYDFPTHTRKKETTLLVPKSIVIVDGIMVYGIKEPRKQYDFLIYVDAESDIRLARRILRDEKERGRTGESVIRQYLATVRPMHKKFIEPCKKYADFVFENDYNNGIDPAQMKALLSQLKARMGKED